jgi:hypothetical protein
MQRFQRLCRSVYGAFYPGYGYIQLHSDEQTHSIFCHQDVVFGGGDRSYRYHYGPGFSEILRLNVDEYQLHHDLYAGDYVFHGFYLTAFRICDGPFRNGYGLEKSILLRSN